MEDKEDRIKYLKNMGTKHSLAQQIVELEDEIVELKTQGGKKCRKN